MELRAAVRHLYLQDVIFAGRSVRSFQFVDVLRPRTTRRLVGGEARPLS